MKNDILIQFGYRIRELDKKSKEKIEESEVIGFHNTYIGLLERDNDKPAYINIDISTDDFDVSLMELIEFTITKSSDNSHD